LKKSISLTTFSVLILFAGVVNTVVIARYFGISYEIEVYFAVLVIYNLFIRFAQAGQISEFFLPRYIQESKATGKAVQKENFSILLNWMVIISFLIVLLFQLANSFLVELILFSRTSEQISLGKDILYYLTPLIGFSIFNSILRILINAEKYYVEAEFGDFISKIFLPLGVLLFFSKFGIFSVVISLWISVLIRSFCYTFIILKFIGYSHAFILKNSNFNFLEFYRNIFGMYKYIASTQIYAFILNSVFAQLQSGQYAIIKYSEQLYGSLENILSKPINIIFFTELNINFSNQKKLHETAKQAISFSILLFFVFYAFYILLGDDVLKFLWLSEKFDIDSIFTTYSFLTFLFPVVLLSIFSSLYRKINASNGLIKEFYNYASLTQIFCASTLFLGLLGKEVNHYISILLLNHLLLLSSALYPLIINKAKTNYQLLSIKFIVKHFIVLICFSFALISLKSFFALDIFESVIFGFAIFLIYILLTDILKLTTFKDNIKFLSDKI